MYLQCRNISFFYPGTEKKVLNDLSLMLDQPGFHAFFGPSGVGKTSLARLLTGHLSLARGQLRTDGLATIFYSYNMERLPGWASIGRHLDRVTPAGRGQLKDDLMNVFGLEGLLQHRFSQLSLGQQNRINLVRYLVQPFDVLIMDESLANVDEMMRGRILLAIKEMFPRTMFIYISHNVVEVAKYCRTIWVIRDAGKSPQALAVQGMDFFGDGKPEHNALQHTMLEIMNAA